MSASTVNFSTAEEWVKYYQARAESLGQPQLNPYLKVQLCQYAEETIDKTILALKESKKYRMTIVKGAIVSAIPVPGSHLFSKTLVTDSAVVDYARKVLTNLGLADASAVGQLYKEALSATKNLPERSGWFAIIAKYAEDYMDDKEVEWLKGQLNDLWDKEGMNNLLDFELADVLGTTAFQEAQDLAHHAHLFVVIVKGYRGGKNAKKRLDMAATLLRDRAIATHQMVFIENAIKRASAKKSPIERKPVPAAVTTPSMTKEERCTKIEKYVTDIASRIHTLHLGWDVGAVTCSIEEPRFDGYTTICHNCFRTMGIGRFYRCDMCPTPDAFSDDPICFNLCNKCYGTPGVLCNGDGHHLKMEKMDIFDAHNGCSVILNPPAPGAIFPCSLCKHDASSVYLHCCKCNDNFNMCTNCAGSMKTCPGAHVLTMCVRYPTWFAGDDE